VKVGIAGTGRMGTAMALRLMDKGHEVTVWNRTRDRTDVAAQAGARVAGTPAELVARGGAVISMLTNAPALRAVYMANDGLLAGDVDGALFIDMSTVRGADHLALAREVQARGGRLIECPVSGTVKPAREGTLFGFAAGSPEAFESARALLQDLCRRVEFVGPIGAGARTKLAVNLLLAVFWQALAEACGIMHDIPIAPGRLIELIADTNIGAGMLKARGADVVAGLEGKAPTPASFDVDFLRKDLRELLQEASALAVPLPVAARTLECFDEASRAGAGAIDATRYPGWWIERLPVNRAEA